MYAFNCSESFIFLYDKPQSIKLIIITNLSKNKSAYRKLLTFIWVSILGSFKIWK